MARILYLTHQLPGPYGGGVSVAYGTLRALARAGWSLRLLSFVDQERPTGIPPEFQEILEGVDLVPLSYRNTPTNYLRSLFSGVPFTTQKYRHRAFARRLFQLLSGDPPDLVFCDHTHTGVYGEVIRRQVRIPVVLRAHNAEHRLWLQYSRLAPSPWKRWALRLQAGRVYRYESRVYTRVNRVIFLSERDRQAFDGVRAEVVPPGVDLAYFTPQEVSPDRKNLIFLGSLNWIPNLDGLRWFLGEVWPRVRSALPGVRLWIVGKEPPPGLGGPGVEVTGFVPDVRPYVRKGGLMVVPLRMGTGVQIKILEALAMGIPVVTSEVGAGGLPHLRPALAVARSPEEWVQRIQELLDSPERYHRLRQEGLQRVRRYHTWDRVGQRLSRILEHLRTGG